MGCFHTRAVGRSGNSSVSIDLEQSLKKIFHTEITHFSGKPEEHREAAKSYC